MLRNFVLISAFFIGACSGIEDDRSNSRIITEEIDTTKKHVGVEKEQEEELKEIDLFESALNHLHSIDYKSSEVDTLKIKDNFVHRSIQDKKDLDHILGITFELNAPKFEGFTSVRTALIKAEYTVGERLYPRAYIEEWQFASVEMAKQAMQELEAIDKADWYTINKIQVIYWQVADRLYYIRPGGKFVEPELEKIKTALNQVLKAKPD